MRYSNKQCSSSYSVFGSRRNCSSGGAERRDSCLQALTEDISTPADVAPSALETIIFDCCMGCISAQTYCLLLAGRYAELPGDLRGVRVRLPCSAVPRTNTRPRLHRRTIHCHLLSLPGTTRACLPPKISRPLLRRGSVAEWLACWMQALKGLGSIRSRDAVG